LLATPLPSQVAFSGYHRQLEAACRRIPGAVHKEAAWKQEWVVPMQQQALLRQVLDSLPVRLGEEGGSGQRGLAGCAVYMLRDRQLRWCDCRLQCLPAMLPFPKPRVCP
jgi:hypothetical protein